MCYTLANGFVVVNLTEDNKNILDFLVDSYEKADDFTNNFLLMSTHENSAVSEYRLHRVRQSDIGLEEFTDAYLHNEKSALCELFLYPIQEHEFSLLTNKIKSGKITYVELFQKHKKYLRAKLIRLLV